MEKTELKRYLIGTIFLLMSWWIGSPFKDTHWPKWMMFYYLAGFGFAWFVFDMTKRLEFAILILAMFASGIHAMADRRSYETMHLISQVDLMGHSARALLVFVLCTLFALFVPTYELIKPLITVAAINIAISVGQSLSGRPNYLASGFLPNYSMHACMIAMVYPLAIFNWLPKKNSDPFGWVCLSVIILGPIAVIKSQSSIGFISFVAMLLAMVSMAMARSFKIRYVIGAVIVIGLCLLSLGQYVDPDWTKVSQIARMKLWPAILDFWLDHGNFWVGMGLGTFRHFGSVIQTQIQVEVGWWWLWAHNDWLQILFETGVLGLAASVLVLLSAFWRAIALGHDGLVGSLVAVSVVSFGNYPLRLAEFAVVVTIIMSAALRLPKSRGNTWKNFYLRF